jgi:hypothetical protein
VVDNELARLGIVVGQSIDSGVSDKSIHRDHRLRENDLRDHALRLELAIDAYFLVLTEGDEALLPWRHDVQLCFAREQGAGRGCLIERHRARGQSHIGGVGEATMGGNNSGFVKTR